MSAGDGTASGSAVGEEVWAGSGVEVEGSELPTFSAAAKVRVGVTIVLFFSSAGGNLAVLWTVTRPQPNQLRSSPVRRLFAHLAAADLLVTFVVMPLDATWNITVQWLAGDIACRTLMFLKLVAMYGAAFLPVVIGLDRQAAVLEPLGPRSGGRKVLGVAWGLSVLLALPQLFLFHTVRRAGPVPFTQCVTKGSFKARWQETTYNLFTFCCLFLLPLTAMAFCYSRIVLSVSGPPPSKRSQAPAGEFNLWRSLDTRPRVRLRALRLALLILLTFVLCWTPYYLLGLWYWFSPTMLSEVPPSLSHILFLFGLLNAPLDPLLYGAFTLGCRRGHQELSSNCSGKGASGRTSRQESQAPRQLEVQTNVTRREGETQETFL
ncbi:gonadotropin-releasing hormone II receptor [Fukomys damarensis]|uniref:Type II GnRH receptor n=1 Tax=Fukomys damarensis TaxID=885580 RepID=A0A091DFV0_FUKDA|nr:gonadotropin-releasing hormone II receptor [Fukomys damarensis]API68527.1 gonadotropin releasing hormone receptor 2 [Fukomys damarensis]KFO31029.1 Gonadotropin-releasing hormone II receptor [Fukomys damarensis]